MYYILVSSNCPCFHIVAEHLSYILNKNNIQNNICINGIPLDVKEKDNLIVFWNSISLNISQIFNNIYIYNLDNTLSDKMNSELTPFIHSAKKLCKNLTVLNFSSNKNDVNYFENMLVDCKILHYGYSEFHEKIYSLDIQPELEKDIDILFYGGFTETRIKKLIEIDKFCKENGYVAVFRNNNLFNEREKAHLIKRSKIVIALPSTEFVIKAQTNDLYRLSFLISNKAFFIVEKLNGDVEDDLLSYGLKLVSYDSFLENLDYYLKNKDEREKIMNNAYEKFKKEYDFENNLLRVLNEK